MFDPFRFSKPPPRPSTAQSTERAQLIAEAAYFLAEKRGFAPGFQLEDWLLAEAQIDIELTLPRRKQR